MKKLLFTLIIVSVTAFTSFAQRTSSFGMGLEVGLPTGQTANEYGYAAGFTLKAETPSAVNNLNYIAYAGFTDFTKKNGLKKAADAGFLPLVIGAKYYIHHWYLQGGVGASIQLADNYTGSKFGFVYAPSVGYSISTVYTDQLDISAGIEERVESSRTISEAVLKVEYRFEL